MRLFFFVLVFLSLLIVCYGNENDEDAVVFRYKHNVLTVHILSWDQVDTYDVFRDQSLELDLSSYRSILIEYSTACCVLMKSKDKRFLQSVVDKKYNLAFMTWVEMKAIEYLERFRDNPDTQWHKSFNNHECAVEILSYAYMPICLKNPKKTYIQEMV